MPAATKEKIISPNAPPVLRLKRPSCSIDKYAELKGVARDTVEECAALGIVQIRKYKGQTFVVDIPNSLNNFVTETIDTNTQAVNNAEDKKDNTNFAGIGRIAAVMFLICLSILFLANLFLTLSVHKIELDGYKPAHTAAMTLFGGAKKQVQTLREQLDGYKAKLKHAQERLDYYNYEIHNLRNELSMTRQNLSISLQRQNAQMAEKIGH